VQRRGRSCNCNRLVAVRIRNVATCDMCSSTSLKNSKKQSFLFQKLRVLHFVNSGDFYENQNFITTFVGSRCHELHESTSRHLPLRSVLIIITSCTPEWCFLQFRLKFLMQFSKQSCLIRTSFIALNSFSH